MYIISTATLVPIFALASSLVVVMQAAVIHTAVQHCTKPGVAPAETCNTWASMINVTDESLTDAVYLYNKDVNYDCTNLVKGDIVRVFLL